MVIFHSYVSLPEGISIYSRQNPLHLSSCYCFGYRFWGSGNQHIRDPTWSQNPFLKRLGNGSRSCLFCWFQVLRQHFMFPSCCIHLYACSFIFLSFACIFLSLCSHFLSLSFHVPFICVHVHSFSFHIPFMLIPMCIHVLFIFLSFACIFLSCCIHVCSFLSKVMEMALWLGQGTECNKWLSLSYR